MNEIIKMLDNNLEYIEHKICEDIIYIKVKSTRKKVICPYCNTTFTKLHSYYKKSFADLPIQSKKVIIVINNRKMLCNNPKCNHKTFAETFDFLSPNSKRTKRLENEIINISMGLSSTVASKILSDNVANISKSTICELLKKRYQ